jgi:RNA polymerase sigma-70 factor (ECF subfamily)
MNLPPDDRYAEDFLRIYRETVRPLYQFVSRRCGGDRSLAEDITQETFLRAVTYWRDGRLPDVPLAWLHHVARNLIIGHFHRRRPAAVDAATLDRMLDPGATRADETAAMVQAGFARLSGAHARVLEAYYLEGKAVRAIADELQLSERAVEGRLRRSRRALRKQLDGQFDFTGGAA